MKNIAIVLAALLAGCGSLTDRIADTTEVKLFRVERTCSAYVPREWLDDKQISAKLAEKLDACLGAKP